MGVLVTHPLHGCVGEGIAMGVPGECTTMGVFVKVLPWVCWSPTLRWVCWSPTHESQYCYGCVGDGIAMGVFTNTPMGNVGHANTAMGVLVKLLRSVCLVNVLRWVCS